MTDQNPDLEPSLKIIIKKIKGTLKNLEESMRQLDDIIEKRKNPMKKLEKGLEDLEKKM